MHNYPASITLGTTTIGHQHPPLVIAEMSGNHNQSLQRALAIVDAAARAGVKALKLQTYTPETMTIESDRQDFSVHKHTSPWAGRSLYNLYSEAHTPWDWHEAIFTRARSLGLLTFSTPFDETAVQFLETMNVPCYKIASFENSDLALMRCVARTGKPILLSTGMATLSDLSDAVTAIRSEGSSPIVLLKCTSAYPATPQQCNIRTLPHLSEMFSCHVGLSDHTHGLGVAVAAVAHGAVVIEKHFTLDRADGGVDSAFSMEPEEMRALVIETERAWASLGSVAYGTTKAEADSIQFRRSLYIVQDLQEGDILQPDNLRAIRPGYGLSPKHYETILGMRVARAVSRGTPMSWDLVRDPQFTKRTIDRSD